MTLDERIAELKSTIFNNRTNFEAHLFVCGESSSDVSDTLENAMELIDELQAENEKLKAEAKKWEGKAFRSEAMLIDREKENEKLKDKLRIATEGLGLIEQCNCEGYIFPKGQESVTANQFAMDILSEINNNQNNNDECNCKFNSKEDDGGESWHYVRKCEFCGYSWHGLHCPHDGYQNPCPECKKTPIIK